MNAITDALIHARSRAQRAQRTIAILEAIPGWLETEHPPAKLGDDYSVVSGPFQFSQYYLNAGRWEIARIFCERAAELMIDHPESARCAFALAEYLIGHDDALRLLVQTVELSE